MKYGLLLAAVGALGCSGVSSNLPAKMTRQLVHDYHCTELHGTRVAQTPDADVWNVDACGRQLRVSCPEGPHSRWRRCELTPLNEVSQTPAAPGSRVRVRQGQMSGGPAVRLRLEHAINLSAVYAPARDPHHVVVGLGHAGRSDPTGCPSVTLTSTSGFSVQFARVDRRYHAPVAQLTSSALSGRLRFQYCGQNADLTAAESQQVLAFLRQVAALAGQHTAPVAGSAPSVSAPGSQGEQVVIVPAPTAGGESPDLRAWLDSHRDVILGCVSADLAVVEITRAGNGPAVVSLRPPHAATPGEECVRAALGTPPGAPPSTPVIHAVRRSTE